MRLQVDLMAERGCETPNDRKTEADPRVVATTGFPALKFHEDSFALGFRNARTRVVDLYADISALEPASHEHAAPLRVSQGVGQKILQDSPQHHRI